MAETPPIVVVGAAGRMGRAILRAALAADSGRLLLKAGVDAPGHPLMGRPLAALVDDPRLAEVMLAPQLQPTLPAGVVIDFSHPDALVSILGQCAITGTPLVIGTTGHTAAQREAIAQAAGRIPIVHSPNMSVGVNVLLKLVETAARALGGDYEIEIVEAHHNQKKDAPSGTALALGAAAAKGAGLDFDKAARYHREGNTGARPRGEIGMQTLRGGDTPGEHTVFYFGTGERLELTHRALSREVFATGAVRAALWLAGRPPGLYGMNHVLGLDPVP